MSTTDVKMAARSPGISVATSVMAWLRAPSRSMPRSGSAARRSVPAESFTGREDRIRGFGRFAERPCGTRPVPSAASATFAATGQARAFKINFVPAFWPLRRGTPAFV